MIFDECEGVAEWVDRAEEEDRCLALEALGVSISATKESVMMSGVLPLQTPEFISNEQSSRCLFSGSLTFPALRIFDTLLLTFYVGSRKGRFPLAIFGIFEPCNLKLRSLESLS